ncbi:hypothetical protein BpHYR1_031270 [Brachionus plicatilis]|uniref:Uncharacterized protein n=1 Tax=Brachionus plicatilis TaxID=10195 RepID=A0A3M7PLK7_BRAPC|nr:hypothetical protein BpHYR1_031270 [Brachionus plicatilis]
MYGWEELLCFLVELFKINLLLTGNIKVIGNALGINSIISFHFSNIQLLTKFMIDTMHEKCEKLRWYPLKFSYQIIVNIL